MRSWEALGREGEATEASSFRRDMGRGGFLMRLVQGWCWLR